MFARRALQPTRRALGGYGRVQSRFASTTATTTKESAAEVVEGAVGKKGEVLQKGARRDPELYVLLTVMVGAFGLVGWYFGRKPTSASSESKIPLAQSSMPWQTEGNSKDFKYQYHPGGDPSKAPKDAPSALNTVIVPNVNLPKSMHDRWNKWGKDGY